MVGSDQEPDPDPYFRLTNPASDPVGPKTYGSGTLLSTVHASNFETKQDENPELL
jgi:hypothetical protein